MNNGNEPAYPTQETRDLNGNGIVEPSYGLTKRELIAAMAMQNPAICDGVAKDNQLDHWFGKNSTNITKPMIVAAQAVSYADALLEALK